MKIPGVIKFKVDGVWKSVLMVEGPIGPPGIGLPGPSGVGGDGILNMEFGCTVTWVRSGYNLIELTKTA